MRQGWKVRLGSCERKRREREKRNRYASRDIRVLPTPLHPPLLHRTHSKSVEFVLPSHSFRDNVLKYLEPLVSSAFTGPTSPISIPLKRNVVIRWNLIPPGWDNRKFSSNSCPTIEHCGRRHFYALLLYRNVFEIVSRCEITLNTVVNVLTFPLFQFL